MKRLNSVLLLLVLMALVVTFAYAWKYPVPGQDQLTAGQLIVVGTDKQLTNSSSPTVTTLIATSETATYRALTPSIVTPTGTGDYTMTPTGISLLYVDNASNFAMILSETGAVNGQELEIVNCSNGTIGFSDSAGVLELSGTITLGIRDILKLRYVTYPWSAGTSQWIQAGYEDN